MEVARSLGIKCHVRGTMLTIEGPRFSSRAESLMFRQWGADVINMTTVPEVVLAKEAGLCYASIAMATDYDCWKEHEEAVSGMLEALEDLFFKKKQKQKTLFICITHEDQISWSTNEAYQYNKIINGRNKTSVAYTKREHSSKKHQWVGLVYQ